MRVELGTGLVRYAAQVSVAGQGLSSSGRSHPTSTNTPTPAHQQRALLHCSLHVTHHDLVLLGCVSHLHAACAANGWVGHITITPDLIASVHDHDAPTVCSSTATVSTCPAAGAEVLLPSTACLPAGAESGYM